MAVDNIVFRIIKGKEHFNVIIDITSEEIRGHTSLSTALVLCIKQCLYMSIIYMYCLHTIQSAIHIIRYSNATVDIALYEPLLTEHTQYCTSIIKFKKST